MPVPKKTMVSSRLMESSGYNRGISNRLTCIFGILDSLDREIDALSDVLKEKVSDDEDVKLLITIPGIGYYSALLTKSEIGEIVRFPNGEKLCYYAGLVPSVRASGGYAKYGSITKQQGSKWPRWIMVEAAHSHVKHDTSISRFYHSLAQRKGKQIAAVATARKLLLCCYSILKKNKRPYYYDQAELSQVPKVRRYFLRNDLVSSTTASMSG
jgi:transposase